MIYLDVRDASTLKKRCTVLSFGMGTGSYSRYNHRAAPAAMRVNLVRHLNVHDALLVMISLEYNGASCDKSHFGLLVPKDYIGKYDPHPQTSVD